MIDTPAVFWLLAIAVCILVTAIITGMSGLFELWNKGNKGGLRSLRGILLAVILLAPLAFHAWLAFALPSLNDISTNTEVPPAFSAAFVDRTLAMNALDDTLVAQEEQQQSAYPRVRSRRYAADASRIYSAIFKLVEQRGWVIRADKSPSPHAGIEVPGSISSADNVLKDGIPSRTTIPRRRPETISEPELFENLDSEEDQDKSETGEYHLEAVARSLLFGFKSDVVIRVVQETDRSLVDMRSSSRWGPHDLGSNAARIVSFLEDLDRKLVGVAGEN